MSFQSKKPVKSKNFSRTAVVSQEDLFKIELRSMCDPREELYQLAEKIPWKEIEEGLSKLDKGVGRPRKEIRRMVGLLILKQLENLSDEQIVRRWSRDPYYQFFCGETHFQWGRPCVDNLLTHFRQDIGEKGVETIFKISVKMHGDEVQKEDTVVIDTTVQEMNTTYPTDTKLRRRIIEKLWKMGEEAAIKWDHSYVRTVPKLLRTLRTRSNAMVKARRKAENKLKTLAGRLLREFTRKASSGWQRIFEEDLKLFERVLSEGRSDSHKVYSLHDPGIYCLAKGKAHQKYEFGRKASVSILAESGVIVGALSHSENLYDGHTLGEVLYHSKKISGLKPESALVDRGYQGPKAVLGTRIIRPDDRFPKGSYYKRRKERKRRARRSAIEPVIGHLKYDYRLRRCYLKGEEGASMNLQMAAAVWNLRQWMRKHLFGLILSWLRRGYLAIGSHNKGHPRPFLVYA